MDTIRIVDFALDPVDRILWITLDTPPERSWIDALELAVVGSVSGATVTVEKTRASLPLGALDEIDAYIVLVGLVTQANDLRCHASPGRSGR